MKAGEIYRDIQDDRDYLITDITMHVIFAIIIRNSPLDIEFPGLQNQPRKRYVDCWLYHRHLQECKRLA